MAEPVALADVRPPTARPDGTPEAPDPEPLIEPASLEARAKPARGNA